MKRIIAFGLSIFLIASCGNKTSKETTSKVNDKVSTSEKKKVLFVLTSHEDLGNTGEKTGFWIEEFATPYYYLVDKGIEVVLSSPNGGQPPIDPKSALKDFETPSTVRFNKDKKVQDVLSKTLKLSNINSADYDAVFFPGGHGPLWDLSDDPNSIKLIERFYNNDKPVAAVCHAPAVFKNTKNKKGKPLVHGKKVTGFSNTEEAAVQLTDIVPFLVEDMLKDNGGIYSKKSDWNPYAIEDGNLITGQNPASSEAVAKILFEKLK